jgi:hypothetical protein
MNTKYWSDNLKERDSLEDLGIGGVKIDPAIN